jgi:hypothetical protein
MQRKNDRRDAKGDETERESKSAQRNDSEHLYEAQRQFEVLGGFGAEWVVLTG